MPPKNPVGPREAMGYQSETKCDAPRSGSASDSRLNPFRVPHSSPPRRVRV